MNHRLAWHLLMRGLWSEAEAYFQQAIAMWKPLGWTRIAPWTLVGLAYLAFGRGEDEVGDQYLNQGLELANRPGQEHFLGVALYLALDRHIRQEDAQAAIAYVDSVGGWPGESDLAYSHLLATRAWVELHRGNIDGAKDLADRATELASADQNRTILVDALRVQGMILASEEKTDEAQQAFEESIAIARTIEQPYAEGRSLEAFGRARLAQGNGDAARDLLKCALEDFERIGATGDVIRITELISAMELKRI